MRVNTIFSADYVPQSAESIQQLQDLAPSWGSWKSWQSCNTHNVICHEINHARALLKRNIQSSCNFYIPQKLFQPLNRPNGVHFYQGDFLEDMANLEDVIAMHLVSIQSDLVLLFGFDISNPGVIDDRLQQHRVKNRLGLIRHAIAVNSGVQWVLVDHEKQPDQSYQSLSNLTCDKMSNVLQLLS